MKIKLLTPLVALVLALGAVVAGPSASADTPVPPPVTPYSPQNGVIFNNPTGTEDEQMAMLNHVTKSIESSPKGSAIRTAVYSFSYGPMSDALIAAHKRGVRVKLLVDSHATTPEMIALKKELGTNKTKSSYYRTCKYGCMSSKPSFMHAKLYMFSQAGDSRLVSMISSANPAWSGGTQAWNNIYTIVGDQTLYDANKKYFSDMLRDKTNTHYYRTTASGPYKEYFFPRNGKTRDSDTIYNVLKEVKCTGMATGYGVNGRTVIRIAAYKWTALRKNVAQQVAILKRQGCDVAVVYSADTVDREVASALLGAKIPVYDARRDRFDLSSNNALNFNLYVHSKYVLINGLYGKTSQKVVYTGSPNFSSNSLRQSNEIMLRVQMNAVYDQFLINYNFIQNNWTARVTKVPARVNAASADSVGERYPNGDDYSIDPGDE